MKKIIIAIMSLTLVLMFFSCTPNTKNDSILDPLMTDGNEIVTYKGQITTDSNTDVVWYVTLIFDKNNNTFSEKGQSYSKSQKKYEDAPDNRGHYIIFTDKNYKEYSGNFKDVCDWLLKNLSKKVMSLNNDYYEYSFHNNTLLLKMISELSTQGSSSYKDFVYELKLQ